MSKQTAERAHLDAELHPLRFIRPCLHYVRPVSLATRLGLLVGRRWCMCYLSAEDEASPPD